MKKTRKKAKKIMTFKEFQKATPYEFPKLTLLDKIKRLSCVLQLLPFDTNIWASRHVEIKKDYAYAAWGPIIVEIYWS